MKRDLLERLHFSTPIRENQSEAAKDHRRPGNIIS